MNFPKLVSSFKIAFSGFKTAFKTEQTFKAQIYIASLALFLMFYLPLELNERIFLLFAIFLVLAFELVNSQIERILDFINPTFHPKIQLIKDLSAAAVLIISIGSAIIGILIFLPYFI